RLEIPLLAAPLEESAHPAASPQHPQAAGPPHGPLDRAEAVADQLQAPGRPSRGGDPPLRRAAPGRGLRRAPPGPLPRATGLASRRRRGPPARSLVPEPCGGVAALNSPSACPCASPWSAAA